MAAIFDTHKFILQLREAAFDERQAEALIAVLAGSHGTWDAGSRRDLSELATRVKAHVSEIKADIIRRVAGMLVARAALIAALVTLL
jgi:hypothetical protein